MRVSLVIFLVGAALAASAQFPPDARYLVSNGQAYAFGNPRQIAVGLGGQIKVSADGDFVAFQRVMPMDPLDEIRGRATAPRIVYSIWNAQADQLWNVAEASAASPAQFEFEWTASAGQGVLAQTRAVQVDKVERMEVLIDRVFAKGRQRQTIARYVLDPGANAKLSPDGRYVLLTGLDGSTRDEVVDVGSGQRMPIARGDKGETRLWGADGSLLIFKMAPNAPATVLKYDFATRRPVPVDGLESYREPAPGPFLVYEVDMPGKALLGKVLAACDSTPSNAGEVAAPPKAPTEAEILAQKDPSLRGPVVLDLDPTEQAISVPGKFVVYAKRGGVHVLPYEKVDVEWLLRALEAKAKAQAMNKAKQVGLALIIYGQDYDDLLPPNTGWQDIVMPYIKNRDMLSGFNYIMNGNNMSSFDNPSNTEIGSVDTPYGRAVVYGDGHAKWQPGSAPQSAFLSLFGEERRRQRA